MLGAVFHQFEITKNSEPSNSDASSSAADLHSPATESVWVVNAYQLAIVVSLFDLTKAFCQFG